MAGPLDAILGLGGGGLPARPIGGGGMNPALMQMLASLTGPQIAPAPAPMAAPGASPIDAQIEEQIRALSQPEPVTPIDVPNAPGTLQKILAAIADSAGIYAGGLNPMVGPIGASGMLADQARARQEAIRANAMNKSSADFRGRQAGAELKLRQLLGQKGAETEAAGAEAKSRSAAAAKAEERAYGESQADIKHRRDLELAGLKEASELKRAQLREGAETARAQLRAQIDQGSKFAKEQSEGLKEAIGEANNFADNIGALIGSGESPDQIRTKFRRFVAKLGLDKEATAIAESYFAEEVEPHLEAKEREDFGAAFVPEGPTLGEAGRRSTGAEAIMKTRRGR